MNGMSTEVCVVGLRGIPGIQGGVESHCEQLLPRLQALGPDYRISVIGRRPSGYRLVSGRPIGPVGARRLPPGGGYTPPPGSARSPSA